MRGVIRPMALAAVLLAGGAAASPAQAPAGPTPRTEHVLVISIDGLRPDAIERYGLRTLQRLMDEGSYTLDARTILPSKTLPSHTSMVTGRTPAHHGITFNRATDGMGVVEVPTMFELARARGLHTAAFFSKAKFRHLDRPGAYDYRQAPRANADNWMATRTVPDAIAYMRHRRPNLLFVHIGEPDYAGHGAGWMGFFYGLAARRADAAVSKLVEAAEDAFGRRGFTVIVTADHGGHGRTHGTDDPLDTTIPWIAWGEGVAAGGRPTGVRTMDTAVTALWLLGVPFPGPVEGAPVFDALRSRAVVAEPDGS
jgi:predicted AlkP superfamily pyrophosphatase or phosphodiesterase